MTKIWKLCVGNSGAKAYYFFSTEKDAKIANEIARRSGATWSDVIAYDLVGDGPTAAADAANLAIAMTSFNEAPPKDKAPE